MVLSNSQSKYHVEFVLFAKEPAPGLVKTRLFPDDPQLGFEFNKAFLLDFAARYQRYCSYEIRPLISFHNNPDFLKRYFDEDVLLPYVVQGQGDLFHRLSVGLSQIETPYFFLTGSDLPHFPFHFLKEVEVSEDTVTIGPDCDGGFYFFAGPKKCSDLFSPAPDSKEVCFDLVRRFETSGYRVKVLKSWSDIDTEKDLVKCLSECDGNDLPHTYRLYSQLKNIDRNIFI